MTSLRPFILIAVLWLAGAVALTGAGTGSNATAMGWAAGLGALALLDLFSLSKAIAVVLGFFSDNHSENKPARMVQAAFWGTIKLLCLGLFGLALMRSREVPMVAILSGVSTLLAVPLIGGFVWSQRELKNAS